MTTPTLSMRMFSAAEREEARRRRRSEAAKKAWRTRRRRATPSPVMRRWLEWLARRPENVVVQRFETTWGSSFNFGVHPETAVPCYGSPQFTRGTFFALQERGWVEMFRRTEDRWTGSSWIEGQEEKHYGHQRYWRITDKGRKALLSPGSQPTL